MKTLSVIILVLVGAVLSSSEIKIGRSIINDHLRAVIEHERQNFPCGWPDFPPNGLPPFEPFVSESPWNVDIPALGEIFNLRSELSNHVMRGLMQFFLHEVRLEIIGMWLRIDFSVDTLLVNGFHATSGLLNNAPFTGQGRFDSTLRNFRFVGTFAMNTIQPGNFLNIRAMQAFVSADTIQVNMEGFGAQTNTINSIINSALPGHLRDPQTQSNINDRLTAVILPIMNGAFNTLTMPDLVNFLSNRASNPPPPRCFVKRNVMFNI